MAMTAEILELFEALDVSNSWPTKSVYLRKNKDYTVYVRLFKRGASTPRYVPRLLQQGQAVKGRALVMANIEIAPAKRGQGFIKALLEEVRSIPDLEILEFECVNSLRLVKALRRLGFSIRQNEEVMPIGNSYFIRLADLHP